MYSSIMSGDKLRVTDQKNMRSRPVGIGISILDVGLNVRIAASDLACRLDFGRDTFFYFPIFESVSCFQKVRMRNYLNVSLNVFLLL